MKFVWQRIFVLSIGISCFQDCSQSVRYVIANENSEPVVKPTYAFELATVIKYDLELDSCESHEDKAYASLFIDSVLVRFPTFFSSVAAVFGLGSFSDDRAVLFLVP
uniref:Neur_chan_LBD domain-containing protein n=1 Tax=Rhabditophanes sp. KR3021 TaxID=114890 RepID=A0AC35TJB5_9BILA